MVRRARRFFLFAKSVIKLVTKFRDWLVDCLISINVWLDPAHEDAIRIGYQNLIASLSPMKEESDE